MRSIGFAAAAAVFAVSAQAASADPEIRTSDVELFYRIYDAAGGNPTAEALQRDYIDAGSPGVREFVPQRIIFGERLARRIAERPEVYAMARTCAAALPKVRERLRPAFRRLARVYPDARFPPVTVLVGRNNSGGTAGPSGVLIGLEVVCATVEPGETVEDRFFHLIVHEYGHVQQTPSPERPDVLKGALVEGVAELLAELATGRISNHHLVAWTKGREVEIGEAFLREADSRDLSNWLYNGRGTPERPGDLGYWVGWRIAKQYYEQAPDKKKALAELIALEDPKAILQASGWRPGR